MQLACMVLAAPTSHTCNSLLIFVATLGCLPGKHTPRNDVVDDEFNKLHVPISTIGIKSETANNQCCSVDEP